MMPPRGNSVQTTALTILATAFYFKHIQYLSIFPFTFPPNRV